MVMLPVVAQRTGSCGGAARWNVGLVGVGADGHGKPTWYEAVTTSARVSPDAAAGREVERELARRRVALGQAVDDLDAIDVDLEGVRGVRELGVERDGGAVAVGDDLVLDLLAAPGTAPAAARAGQSHRDYRALGAGRAAVPIW